MKDAGFTRSGKSGWPPLASFLKYSLDKSKGRREGDQVSEDELQRLQALNEFETSGRRLAHVSEEAEAWISSAKNSFSDSPQAEQRQKKAANAAGKI
jgi:hypothetical protein